MKRTLILLFAAILGLSATGQSVSEKKSPIGKWTFDAPSAPEGFTTGTIEVAMKDSKFTVMMAFTSNSEYKLPGENVKFENETLAFGIYMQGEEITINLKMEELDKMNGRAVYSGGEVMLMLAREKKKE
ncbi:MAG: hypothetical protein U0X39_09225 [Bacteroidales bacterium]